MLIVELVADIDVREAAREVEVVKGWQVRCCQVCL